MVAFKLIVLMVVTLGRLGRAREGPSETCGCGSRSLGADSTTGLRDFAIDLVAMGLLVAVGIEPLVDVASTLVVQWRMGDEPEEVPAPADVSTSSQ